MEDKIKILKELDAAIEAMDESAINIGLNALRELEEKPLSIEEPISYAARIFEQNRREIKMIKPKKYLKVAIAAAAIALMGITAYAATTLNLFGFVNGDHYVTVRTNETMTEQEAKALVEAGLGADIPEDSSMMTDTQEYLFDSVKAAEEAMDMKIPVPAVLPEMQLESVHGTVSKFGNATDTRTVWVNYFDQQERMFGITVVREIILSDNSGSYTSHGIDPGSLGTYKSKSGIEYTTLTEGGAGDNAMHIATVMIGEYEYTLVFSGFDEVERKAIIDSADLSVYK